MTWKELSNKIPSFIELMGIVVYRILLLYALYFIGMKLHSISEILGYLGTGG